MLAPLIGTTDVKTMYVITGITGKVGGALARALLNDRQPVRAVVRDASKAGYWAALGCEVAIAQMDDAAALTEAFKGATGVFILPPPGFDPAPGFPEARAGIAAVAQAIDAAAQQKVLCLSTIGAQAEQLNLLTQRLVEGAGTECAGRTSDVPAPGLVYGKRRIRRDCSP